MGTLICLISESLKIGDDITITVLGIRGDEIRIGLHIPEQTPIHRLERDLRKSRHRTPIVNRPRKPRSD